MMLEEIIRFTIPGATVVVALLIAFWPLFKRLVDVGAGAIVAALAAILVVPIGYLMHQIYQMWHQSKKGRFASFKRPAFKLMKQKYKESRCKEIGPWQARLAWDSWFGRCGSERFANILSTQHIWWLSSKTMIVAFSIGMLLLLVGCTVLYLTGSRSLADSCYCSTVAALFAVYLSLAIFFCLKAKSTGNYLWLLERCAVADNWRQIDPLLDRIVEEWEKECQERPVGILYSVGCWGRRVQGFPERKSPPKRRTE